MSRDCLTKEEILNVIKCKGSFVIDRNSYRASKLRCKLKSMSKGKNPELIFHSASQKYLIFKGKN